MANYRDKLDNPIRQLRESATLTREELSDVLGVTAKSISNWEFGESKPSFDSIMKLADFFKVDPITLKREFDAWHQTMMENRV